jgi:hypothetical protein
VGVVAGLVLVALFIAAIVVALGGTILGRLPSFIFWLIPVNPDGLAAKLLTGGFVAFVALVILFAWSRRGDAGAGDEVPEDERRRRKQAEDDADDFAWWMTEGPAS